MIIVLNDKIYLFFKINSKFTSLKFKNDKEPLKQTKKIKIAIEKNEKKKPSILQYDLKFNFLSITLLGLALEKLKIPINGHKIQIINKFSEKMDNKDIIIPEQKIKKLKLLNSFLK